MLDRAVFGEDVETELKWNLLIGTTAFADGNGEHGSFKTEEVGGKAMRREIGCRSCRVEIGLPGN